MGELLIIQVSFLTAVLASFALSFFFVASLYLWTLIGYQNKRRNDPGTIQRRFASACLSCVCSAGLVWALARPAKVNGSGLTPLELFGLGTGEMVRASCACLCLTTVIFAGPIVQHLTAVTKYKAPLVKLPVGQPWVAARDYIMAPTTEEFVFRACLVRLWVAASIPKAPIIFLSPLCFAMAHTHHFIELFRCTRSKRVACLEVSFQVFYTSLFGMYSNFLLLRTGSIVGVTLSHAFCNHQGFPDYAFLVSERHALYKYRFWLGAVYASGIFAFGMLLAPMTEGFASTFAPP